MSLAVISESESDGPAGGTGTLAGGSPAGPGRPWPHWQARAVTAGQGPAGGRGRAPPSGFRVTASGTGNFKFNFRVQVARVSEDLPVPVSVEVNLTRKLSS